MRGSIDLIERRSDGRLRVIDHKTGKFPDKPPQCIGNGEVLQPLLYALRWSRCAAKRRRSRSYPMPPCGAAIARVTCPSYYARDRVRRVLALIDKWIDQGFLPAAPKRGGCERCEYLPVCGPYEEQRVAEQAPARTAGARGNPEARMSGCFVEASAGTGKTTALVNRHR